MNRVMDPVHAMRPGVLQLNALPPLSLYVHLPWCIKKCPYCDFNSHELREGADPVSTQDAYIHALLADLEASLPLIWGRSIQTVFLGGGTPSLFSPEAIDRLISGIRARVRLAPDAEITLEANPGTFEKDRFKAFHQAGITRLSIGVQSFDNAHLKALGRVHDRDQALAAVTEAAQVFDTFNLDLMYALPGQTLEGLSQDIQTALAFAPPHISIYHLTIEPNTVFAKFPPALPEDDLAYEMMDRITELTASAGLQPTPAGDDLGEKTAIVPRDTTKAPADKAEKRPQTVSGNAVRRRSERIELALCTLSAAHTQRAGSLASESRAR